MINNENQFFYLAIVGQNLHIDYFESKDSNSSHQKNYLMPDTLDDNLNLIVLSKFILEKVKDFEKDVGRFIDSSIDAASGVQVASSSFATSTL